MKEQLFNITIHYELPIRMSAETTLEDVDCLQEALSHSHSFEAAYHTLRRLAITAKGKIVDCGAPRAIAASKLYGRGSSPKKAALDIQPLLAQVLRMQA